jgi:hypothetical protein
MSVIAWSFLITDLTSIIYTFCTQTIVVSNISQGSRKSVKGPLMFDIKAAALAAKEI